MSRRKRMNVEYVEPELPITPMLDMSFQLLAFFIMTFRPAATEGQIAMSLPPPDLGGPSTNIPSITEDKPQKWIAKITATEAGKIANINLREDGAAATEGEDLGADPKTFLKRVQGYADAEKKRIEAAKAKGQIIPPPKLTLEIGEKLLQAHVIQMFDASVQAGFSDIAPVPIDKAKR